MTTPTTSRGITQKDVWRAADALLLEGARPTIERIRNKIGRGSPNTVSPHLETWFRLLGARIADPMAFSAPPALPDPISQAAEHFWEAALAAARAEATESLTADRRELQSARDSVDRERAQLKIDRERIDAQLQAKEESLQLMRAHLTESQTRAEALSFELAAKDRALMDLRGQQSQMETERDALRTQLEAERAAFEQARRDLEDREAAHEARWALEVDRAREAAKSAIARLAHQEKELGARIEQLNRSLHDDVEQRRRLTESRDRQEAELMSLRTAREVDLAAQRTQHERHEKMAQDWQDRAHRLESQLAAVLKQLEIKEAEHGSLLRTLITRSHTEPIATSPRKRKRAAGR